MAKKNINISKVILDTILIVLGVAMLCFVAAPHIELEVTLLGSSSSSTASGYSLISFGDGDNIGVAVVLLLLVIFASIMIVGGILKLLADCNVISDKTFGKIASCITLVSSLCVAVLSVVNMITVATSASNSSFGSIASGGTYAEWATLSVILIVGIASFVVSLLPLLKKKK